MKKSLSTLFVSMVFLMLTLQTLGQNSQNGNSMTPKGNQKFLIIYAAFDGFLNENLDRWPNGTPSANNNWGFPNYVNATNGNTTTSPLFFNSSADFDDPAIMGDPTNKSISKTLNLMSKPNEDFRLYGDVFSLENGDPTLVMLDPATFVPTPTSWSTLNKRTIEAAMQLNPNFDWSAYDTRANSPGYNFDASQTGPDGKLDYVVVIYRYSNGWNSQPITSMNSWSGSGGGFASINVGTVNGVQFGSGFTMAGGAGLPLDLFMHEFTHSLYNNPHTLNSNNVVGKHFNGQYGWGAMAYPGWFSNTMNAWERWYLGYITPTEVTTDGSYNLNDFTESGDALRILIPNSNNQYLWIENRRVLHELDQTEYYGNGSNAVGPGNVTVPGIDPGVFMFVEDIAPSRNDLGIFNKANGFKVIHADGNWDYQYNNVPTVNPNWGPPLYQVEKKARNPISGINPATELKADFMAPFGMIDLSTGTNTPGGSNEEIPIMREKVGGSDKFWYRAWGGSGDANNRGPAFQPGDVLEMQGDMVLNYPTYDKSNKQLSPYFLNGLKVEVINTGETAVVDVKFKQTLVDKYVRWAGNIVLPNITEDSDADLVLGVEKMITVNASRVANRHTLHPETGTFVNPSTLTISSGAKLHLLEKSNITIKEGSTLIIEDGAEVLMEQGACIVIEADAKLIMNGNNIQTFGEEAVIVIRGTLETADGVDFTFTGPGYASFSATHQLNMGVGSDFIITDDSGGQTRCLLLKENTVLDIVNRELRLHGRRVEYEANSQIRTTYADVRLSSMSLEPRNTPLGFIALEGENLVSCEILSTNIKSFEKGLLLFGKTCIPKIVNCDINTCTVGIEASTMIEINMLENKISNSTETAVDLTSITTANMIKNGIFGSTFNGYYAKQVAFLNIEDGAVTNCNLGVIGIGTNTFVRKGATISNCKIGIFYYGNQLADHAVTVGDLGCANIINNTVGIGGDNIVLNIDAIIHANNNGDPDNPLANRFDGNQVMLDICYKDPSFQVLVLQLKGNYWGGLGLGSYTTNLRTTTGSCSNAVPLNFNDSFFETSVPSNNCDQFVVPPGKPNAVKYKQPFNCLYDDGKTKAYTHNLQRYGHLRLANGNTSSAKYFYGKLAGLDIEKGSYPPTCVQYVHYARCMVKMLGSSNVKARISQEDLSEERPINAIQELSIAPNPSSGIVSVEIPKDFRGSELILHLSDVTGVRINSYVLPTQAERFEINEKLPRGIYFLSLTVNGELKGYSKLVREPN